MDLENGDTIYVEATVNKTVELRSVHVGLNTLTPDEARTLATALIAAAVEAEDYVVYR